MQVIETHKISYDDCDDWEKSQIYNGLDTCITAEVLEALLPQLDTNTASTYAFSKALQAPVLEMRLRGVLVDKARKQEVIDEYYDQIDFLERNLERIVREGIGYYGFKWTSNADLQRLFYQELGIPHVRKLGKLTVNRDAIESFAQYTSARVLVSHICAMKDIHERIKFLKSDADADGRMRTSYNIAGTNTFRFTSSMSEFGTGRNLQNVEDFMRQIFIADPGMKMAYIDAEQIQSRIVGAIEWNELDDGRYLDACETGNIHTAVARMCWPKLAWIGDIKKDTELAEKPFYRHYSRRFLCKKLGHGSNFDGRPPHMAQQTRIDLPVVEEFHRAYFAAFAHAAWHEWNREQIESVGQLISLTGHKRQFWGRRNNPDIHREGLAYIPQADESRIVNSGMLQVWRERDCQLLLQNHDAIIVQYPGEREDEVIPKLLKQLRYPVELKHGRTLIIPYGCKTGWNWGEWSEGNPDGLKAYTVNDKRKRIPQTSILDRKSRKAQGAIALRS